MLQAFALLDGIVLLGISRSDLLAVDAAFEDLNGGWVFRRELRQWDQLLRSVGDESGVDESRFDELFKDGLGDFKVFILFADFCAKFDGSLAPLLRCDFEPIGSGPVADDVLVLNSTPRRSEIDGFEHLALGIFVLDDQCAQNLLSNVADHRLDQFHHAFVIAVGLVGFEHGEFRVVLAREALVAEIAPNLKYSVHAAYQQTFEVKLQGDAQVEIAPQRVVVSFEGLCRRAAGYGQHHGGLDFDETALVQKIPNFADNLAAFEEDIFDLRVGHEIEVSLAVADFRVGQTVPFFRGWTERFGQDNE